MTSLNQGPAIASGYVGVLLCVSSVGSSGKVINMKMAASLVDKSGLATD